MNWLAKRYDPSLIAFAFLVIIHAVGLVGLNSTHASTFENIAWLNLLLSFIIVIAFHRGINLKFFAFCTAAFTIGMLAEMIGVKTGQPFGLYYYTAKFGWQLFTVPLIIGLNWVLLAYVCGIVAHQYIVSKRQAAAIAAASMTLIDLLLEPFAIRHGFWVWGSKWPPIQNYVAWFGVALLIQLLYSLLIKRTENAMTLRYGILLVVFLALDFCWSFM